tara:strand:- start:161 stop:328 length:168 start_codon:yes stop_codon:yes gene_type:complete
MKLIKNIKLITSINAGPNVKKIGKDITKKLRRFFSVNFIIEDILSLFIQYIHINA